MKFSNDETLIDVFGRCMIGTSATKEAFYTKFICYITDKRIILEPEQKVDKIIGDKVIRIATHLLGFPYIAKKIVLNDFLTKNCNQTAIIDKDNDTYATISETNFCTVELTTSEFVAYLNFNSPSIVLDVCYAINSPFEYLTDHL